MPHSKTAQLYRGCVDLVKGLATCCIAVVLGVILLIIFQQVDRQVTGTTNNLIAGKLAYFLVAPSALASIVLLHRWMFRLTIQQYLLVGKRSGAEFLAGMSGMMILALLSLYVGAWLVPEPIMIQFSPVLSAERLSARLLFDLTAGAFEELLFRGFLFIALARLSKSVPLAAIASSLVFVGVHTLGTNGSPSVLWPLGVFGFGVMFAYLYAFSGSLLLVVASHATWNLMMGLFERGEVYGVVIIDSYSAYLEQFDSVQSVVIALAATAVVAVCHRYVSAPRLVAVRFAVVN